LSDITGALLANQAMPEMKIVDNAKRMVRS
jgi:hypothetical protein